MASVPAPLLCINTGNGWSVIVVWDTGACWLDRYWSTYLYCCVLDLVVGFGGVAFADCNEGDFGLDDQKIRDPPFPGFWTGWFLFSYQGPQDELHQYRRDGSGKKENDMIE